MTSVRAIASSTSSSLALAAPNTWGNAGPGEESPERNNEELSEDVSPPRSDVREDGVPGMDGCSSSKTRGGEDGTESESGTSDGELVSRRCIISVGLTVPSEYVPGDDMIVTKGSSERFRYRRGRFYKYNNRAGASVYDK